MPPHTTRPPLRTARRAAGTRVPTGAEIMAVSSGSGGASSEPPAQAAPSAREGLRRFIAGPCEGEHRAALPAADLGDDVRGGSETVDADGFAASCGDERAPADQPGAQQRRRRNRILVACGLE